MVVKKTSATTPASRKTTSSAKTSVSDNIVSSPKVSRTKSYDDEPSFFDNVLESLEKNAIYSFLVGLIIITFAINIAFTWYVTSANVASEIEKVEAMKVGGQANYDLFKKIAVHPKQSAQYQQQLQALLADLDGGAAPSAPTPGTDQQPTAPSDTGTISADQLAKIMEGSYVAGNADSDIVIIEYSDVECPFCQKHHENGTINQVVAQFEGKVSSVFNHFPLSFHPNAQKGAEALECFADQQGADGFNKLVAEVFKRKASSSSAIVAIATEFGGNADEMNTCITSGKYTQKVQTQMSNGSQIFAVNGTPGNVIINKKTGKRKVISGAYPASEFVTAINTLLE